MSSTDAAFHSARDLMYALPYSEPEILLVKLGNVNKDLLSTLAEIFRKAKKPRSTSKGASQGGIQRKLQQVNL